MSVVSITLSLFIYLQKILFIIPLLTHCIPPHPTSVFIHGIVAGKWFLIYITISRRVLGTDFVTGALSIACDIIQLRP